MRERARWVGWALVVAACGSGRATPEPAPPPAATTAPVKAAEPGPVPYELPRAEAPAPATMRCVPAPAAARPAGRVRQYDFAGDDVYPVEGGPRTRDLGDPQLRRTRAPVRAAIGGRATLLGACWRAVRFATKTPLDRDHELSVWLVVDPAGNAVDIDVKPVDPAQGGDRLATCAAGALRGLAIGGTQTARRTEVTGTIRFERSGLSHPGRRPRAPAPFVPPRVRASCTEPAELPNDRLDVGVLARIDDWEAAHADREDRREARRQREEERRAARREGRAARVATVPRRHIDCGVAASDYGKAHLRAVLRSNGGAYSACYRDALARSPELEGEMVATIRYDGRAVTGVELSALGDAGLQTCMKDALLELSSYPWPARVESATESRFPFRFRRTPPVHAGATALERGDAALEVGDRAAALAAYAEAVRGSRGGADACDGRLGVLWTALHAGSDGHPFVWAAALDLARYAGGAAAARARPECLDAAAKLTARAARWPLEGAHVWFDRHGIEPGHDLAAGRIAVLLEAWPKHPERAKLLVVRARSLLEDGRKAGALALFPADSDEARAISAFDPATVDDVTRPTTGAGCGGVRR